MLEDAFKCCVRGNVSGEGSRMRKQEEIKKARAWFLSEDADAGTFLWVCEKLDLDPKKILDKIPGLYEKTRKAA